MLYGENTNDEFSTIALSFGESILKATSIVCINSICPCSYGTLKLIRVQEIITLLLSLAIISALSPIHGFAGNKKTTPGTRLLFRFFDNTIKVSWKVIASLPCNQCSKYPNRLLPRTMCINVAGCCLEGVPDSAVVL